MHRQNNQNTPKVKERSTPRASAKEAVKGRENQILQCLGVKWPVARVSHIHCPFPDHDDATPSWRWDAAKTRWFCTCGSGDIFDAIQRFKGGGFASACRYIEAALEVGSAYPLQEKRPETPDRHRPIAALGSPAALAQWEGAKPIAGQAERYLTGPREISLANWPAAIRFAPALPHKTAGGAWSHHPAILIAMTRAPGAPVEAVGRIWLAADGSGKIALKPAKALGAIKGLACWLGTPGPRLVLVEGIEDALTLLMAGAPFVACAFTGANLASVVLPTGVLDVLLFGDRAKFGGIDATGAAALARGRPLWEAAGAAVRATAPDTHKDANDVLRAIGLDALRRLLEV